MRKIISILPLITLLLIILLVRPLMAQSIHQTMERVCQSLVKVQTEKTSASGFLWQDSSTVVTSLHVVDGQNRVSVNFVNPDGKIGHVSRATVEKVHQDADLVLLRLQKPLAGRAPLIVEDGQVSVKQSLDALGFPMNIASCSNTEVKVRFGGKELRAILPPKALAKLKGRYPSSSLRILNLEGNLVPGLSGAPIIDPGGKVVGIVDGGLESGAIGISWGIPASELEKLASSSVTQLPGLPGIGELFAADLEADVQETKVFGSVRLTKLRSRTLAQLAATADDQLGLSQLATFFSANPPYFSPETFRYDIYQDMDSGATIAVPEGAEIIAQDDYFIASVGDSRMEMLFIIQRVNDYSDAQYKAVTLEQRLVEQEYGTQVMPDPAWSYLVPMNNFGIVVNRKALLKSRFDGLMWQPEKYYFETLATNGATLLGVAAVNNNNTPQMLQMESFCVQGYNNFECAEIIRSREVWAQMVLGVQLASFPQVQFGN